MKNYAVVLGILLVIGLVVYLTVDISPKPTSDKDKILMDSIKNREREILMLDSVSKILNVKKDGVIVEINRITKNTDSLELVLSKNKGKIHTSISKIKNLKKQSDEEINSIDSWDFNNYNSFFTNYFKDKQ